jgi:hypothetical protein
MQKQQNLFPFLNYGDNRLSMSHTLILYSYRLQSSLRHSYAITKRLESS